MTPIVQAMNEIQNCLTRLSQLCGRFKLSHEDMSLEQALQLLAGGLPVGHCLQLTIWNHGDESGPKACWDAWDGKNHFSAPLLADAVNAALLAHKEPEQAPLPAALEIIHKAQAADLPF